MVAFRFGYVLMPRIVNWEVGIYKDLFLLFGGFIVGGALFFLMAVLVQEKWIRMFVAVVIAGAPYLFLPATKIALSAFGASIALMLFAAHRMRRECELSLGLSVAKISARGLPLYFTIAALTLSLFYFSNLNEERAFGTLLPKSVLEYVMVHFSETIESFTGIPLGRPDATVDDLLTNVLKNDLLSQGIKPAEVSQQEFTQLLTGQRESLIKQFGLTVSGEEKVGEVLYAALTARIQSFLGPYVRYLPAASALVFFFAVKTITIPLYYFTLFAAFLLIKLMRFSRILKSEKQQIEVERLTL